MRQHVPRISTKRPRHRSSACRPRPCSRDRTPVSRPASSSAAESPTSVRPRRRPPGRRRRRGRRRCRTEPAGQRGERRAAPGSRRPARRPSPRTSALPPTRPDSGEATMLRTRSWVGDGSRPGGREASATRGGLVVADAADLDVAARGQLHRRGAEPVRRVRQRLQLRRGDHPAGQPDPGQRAVGGLVHLQRAWAGVLVAGPGHQFTVRPSCWRASRQTGVVATTRASIRATWIRSFPRHEESRGSTSTGHWAVWSDRT